MEQQKCSLCGTKVDTEYEIDPAWVCPLCEERKLEESSLGGGEDMKQEPDITVPTEADVVDAMEKKRPFDLAALDSEVRKQYKKVSPISRFRENHIREEFREPTTSDPVRLFDAMQRDSIKEKEVARLMYKIAGGRGYTVSEYREIEATVRKVADLPQRDYAILDRPKGWQDG